MSSPTFDQVQLETLSQLLAAGGHHDIAGLLGASLGRLVAFWPAQAGALLYLSPHGENVHLEHGPLSSEARTMIEQARTSFARRDESTEPTIGYYSLEGGYDLLELPLQSNDQGVGLLHLVVATDTGEKGTSTAPLKPDEDLLILLVRSIGGEADKLAMLQRAERDLRNMRMLYEVGQSLVSYLEMPRLLQAISRHTAEAIQAERSSVFLLDEDQHELVLDQPEQGREVRIPADRGIAGWVVTHGIPQIVSDVEQDPRWYDVAVRDTELGNRSLVCVPIRAGDRMLGAVQLLNKHHGDTFTDQDAQLLTTLAAQAGIAIANARRYQQLQQQRDQLLHQEARVRSAISRDMYGGPTQRLSAITMNIEFIKKLLVAMPERVAGELDTLTDLVNQTMVDIRTFLFDLHPVGLKTQGLLPTMQQYVANWQDFSGSDTRLRLQAPPSIPRLPYDVETAIFTIIQEAIHNASQHARAPEIVTYLYVEEVHLIASVRDRGRGFNVSLLDVESSQDRQGSGMGIASMRARAQSIQSDLRIRSEVGSGTIVELRVPLS
jgi:signal transduction histidine kinase